jgi:hypothetical protein
VALRTDRDNGIALFPRAVVAHHAWGSGWGEGMRLRRATPQLQHLGWIGQPTAAIAAPTDRHLALADCRQAPSTKQFQEMWPGARWMEPSRLTLWKRVSKGSSTSLFIIHLQAGPQGFEPWLTDPESVVLPLH